MSKRRRRIEVVVESLAAGGDGVARGEDGRVTFVPRAAPGDRLLVSLVQERKQFARGKVVKVLEPSEVRVTPKCTLFIEERCGGCQWQHVSYAEQVRQKEQILAHRFSGALAPETWTPLQPSASADQYRCRCRLHWHSRQGQLLLGFHQPRSREIVDVAEQVGDQHDQPGAWDAFGHLAEDRPEVGLAVGLAF